MILLDLYVTSYPTELYVLCDLHAPSLCRTSAWMPSQGHVLLTLVKWAAQWIRLSPLVAVKGCMLLHAFQSSVSWPSSWEELDSKGAGACVEDHFGYTTHPQTDTLHTQLCDLCICVDLRCSPHAQASSQGRLVVLLSSKRCTVPDPFRICTAWAALRFSPRGSNPGLSPGWVSLHASALLLYYLSSWEKKSLRGE